ncbi:MAG: hypothetical protein V1644_03750 [Candidatus Micrarchaeota archaeon]
MNSNSIVKKIFFVSSFFLFLLALGANVNAAALPTVGLDSGTWGTILNDFLSVSLYGNGTLMPDAVTNATLRGTVNGSLVLIPGSINATSIAPGVVNVSHIAGLNITAYLMGRESVNATHIVPGAVNSSHIAAGNITGSKLAPQSVHAANIELGNVNGSHIVPGAVNSSHIAAYNITGTHIQLGSLNGTQLANGAINSSHIFPLTINNSHLAYDSVQSHNLVNGVIHDYHLGAEHYNISETNLTIGTLNISKGNITIGAGGNVTIRMNAGNATCASPGTLITLPVAFRVVPNVVLCTVNIPGPIGVDTKNATFCNIFAVSTTQLNATCTNSIGVLNTTAMFSWIAMDIGG